jgi:NAD(P)-dependent dehydrogenase (short-subunit alcohol dehydrogenase family)
MDLTNASAIVTGGAGGFGSATVRRLAQMRGVTTHLLTRDLDQVAARVVEYGCRHRARFHRLLGEPDTETAKSLELVPNVLDGERREGNAVPRRALA